MPLPLPAYPLIAVSSKDNLSLLPDDHILQRVSTSVLLNDQDAGFFYDIKGRKWSCLLKAANLKNTWLNRILARTIYDPLHKVNIEWKNEGEYELIDLKEEIYRCIDADDDVLTQFEEGDIIKNAVENAITFEQLTSILKKYIFEVKM